MTDISKLVEEVLRVANEKEHIAGQQGAMHDGGASILRMQVEYYRYGSQGKTPPSWNSYQERLDPEYDEYLRLKEKFKNY